MINKKGISLVMLVITIVVMLILASTVFLVSDNTVSNSKKATLALDLEQIEDLISSYYINNDELPIDETASSWKKEGLVDTIEKGYTYLSEEIDLNGDGAATFYKVDLSKLDIENISRGIEEDEDETDIFVVADKSFNVYYLRGEEINGEYYFSLSKRLTNKTKVDNSANISDDSDISIDKTTTAIKLTKNTNDWTNSLTVSVSTTLAEDETLKYFIVEEDVTTSITEGTDINVSDILLADATLKSKFSNEANKKVRVQKYIGTELIAESDINIDNLDVISGDVIAQQSITYTKYDLYTLANVSAYSDLGGSGVKEARVLYTKKLNDDGSLTAYYDDLPEEITADYVRNVGVSSSPSIIKLPNDVANYILVFIDNAGNVSEAIEYTTTM